MSKLAWIGLGVMGYPMAGHLRTCGHDVTVFNRGEEGNFTPKATGP
jgi:3-hydroxyisobutyrate dehydrogenase